MTQIEEVRVAHLRRHGPAGLTRGLEPLGDVLGEALQLLLEPLDVGHVARERLLGR